MERIKQRLGIVERDTLLWVLCQAIHELTIRARFFYDQPDAAGEMQETNEAIHHVSGHLRDLIDRNEPFTSSRADGVGEALKLLTPTALDRLYGFTA
jgi:hypothetical protein